MASSASGRYVSFRVSGLPAGSFGETYVITAAAMSGNNAHRGEFFIVSKRHQPHMYHNAFEFLPGDVPEELVKVDEDYVLSEARDQAQNYLDDVLYQLAEKYCNDVLARYGAMLANETTRSLCQLIPRGLLAPFSDMSVCRPFRRRIAV